jgi:pimeloyl-ACP methyl ester carboxylesterase
MRRRLLWVFVLLGYVCTTVARAETRIPSEGGVALGGLWKGKLSLLGGQLDVTISVVPLAGGKYFGALDVPAQKVSRTVTEIVVRGDSVLMKMPSLGSRYDARYDAAKQELSGAWTSAGVKSVVVLRHSPMPTTTAPGTRLAPPYREEEVVVNNPTARLNLSATLTVPAGPGPFPAVLLVSDVDSQDRDGTIGDYHMLGALADYLTRRGIAVLRYDDRGVGQSGGNSAITTTAMRVSDVQAAMNFLRARLEININRIGVIGHGEGANVALLAAGQPLPPAFVVSLAGYGLPGEQTLLEQQVAEQRANKLDPALVQAAYERQRTMYSIIRNTNPPQAQAIVSNMLRQDQPTLTPEAAQAAATKLLTPWRRFFLTFDPIAELDQVQCPVLLLSGTNDQQSPAELHLVALEKELKSVNRAVTVKRLAGVNHLFQPPQTEWTLMNGEMMPLFSPVAEDAIREWIVGLWAKDVKH